MKTTSIRKNFVFNLIRNISFVIFPIITFPYLSRVLTPIGIGKIQFATAFVQYFVIFSSLGIPLYGIREIAKNRDNKEKMSQIVNELLQLNILAVIFVYLIFLCFLFFNQRIASENVLFLITSFNIIFTAIGIEWFYQGLEKYEFITKRSIYVRVISILLIFLLVKAKEDYLLAAIISFVGLMGSNVINLVHARKYIKFDLLKKYDLKKHSKPILLIFAMTVIIGLYVSLDSVMLGFMKNDIIVGYYTSAVKFNKVVISIMSSLGIVLMPRIAYYLENNMQEQYKSVTSKAFDLMFLFNIPAMIGLFILADDIIFLFSGGSFAPAILTMKIMAPIIFFIAISNLVSVQILYPLKKEKLILYAVFCGAILNLSLNFLLIPSYSQNGAAIATVIAEFGVMSSLLFLSKKYLKVKFFTANKVLYIFAAIVMGLVIFYFKNLFDNIILRVILTSFLGLIIYLAILLFFKDKFLIEELRRIFKHV